MIEFEFYDKFTRFNTPHIIFSVSKSLTSLLTGILVEKNAELDEKDKRRKFKYRVVFRGNDAKDH